MCIKLTVHSSQYTIVRLAWYLPVSFLERLLLIIALSVLLIPVVFLSACVSVDQPVEEPEWHAYLVQDPASPPAEAPRWLAIAPSASASGLQELMRWRDSRSFKPALVTAESIYQAFGNGAPQWESIALFLNTWRRHYGDAMPRYLLLCGTADQFNQASMYLPSVQSRQASMTSTFDDYKPSEVEPLNLLSDYPYSVPGGGIIPDIAIGRLPARSPYELNKMADKIAEYEQSRYPSLWSRRIDILNASAIPNPNDWQWQAFLDWVPPAYEMNYTHFELNDPYSLTHQHSLQIAGELIGNGSGVIIYWGPGFQNSWGPMRSFDSSYMIMNNASARRLINPGKRSLIIALASWTARFDGTTPSLAEELLSNPNGPALYIGASRRTVPYTNIRFAAAMRAAIWQNAFNHNLQSAEKTIATDDEGNDFIAINSADMYRVGDHLLSTRQALLNGDINAYSNPWQTESMSKEEVQIMDREVLWNFNLLGDPASPLPLETHRFKGEWVTMPYIMSPGERVTIQFHPENIKRARLRVALKQSHDRGIDQLRVMDANTLPEIIRRHKLANAKTILETGLLLDQGKREWTFTVPDDAPLGITYMTVLAELPDGIIIDQKVFTIVDNPKQDQENSIQDIPDPTSD